MRAAILPILLLASRVVATWPPPGKHTTTDCDDDDDDEPTPTWGWSPPGHTDKPHWTKPGKPHTTKVETWAPKPTATRATVTVPGIFTLGPPGQSTQTVTYTMPPVVPSAPTEVIPVPPKPTTAVSVSLGVPSSPAPSAPGTPSLSVPVVVPVPSVSVPVPAPVPTTLGVSLGVPKPSTATVIPVPATTAAISSPIVSLKPSTITTSRGNATASVTPRPTAIISNGAEALRWSFGAVAAAVLGLGGLL